MDELAEMLPSVMTQLKWVTPLLHVCRKLINNNVHKLTVCLQSLSNQWFLCRVNSVIGIGVGAGAYILSRFAVSPLQDQSLYTFILFVFLLLFNSFFCPPLCLAWNNWSVSSHIVCLPSNPHRALGLGSSTVCSIRGCSPDDALVQWLSSCFYTQRSRAKISTICVQQSRKS